ncbi:MAG: hypothetical protein WCI50_03820 [Actinomycetes bacterium]
MSTFLLVGTGEVAIRAARQLVDTPGCDHLLIASREPERARDLAASLHAGATGLDHGDVRLPDGLDAVVVGTHGARAREWTRAAVEVGVAVATTRDAGLTEIDPAARANDVAVVTGASMCPGLSDVLAAHAAALFSRVDEVHVARAGAAGPACVDEVRVARKEVPGEWRGGEWRADRIFGPELVWFPEPVGQRECHLVTAGVAATVATVPTARLVTVRLCGAPSTSWLSTRVRRNPVDAGWGAVRIEVRGLVDDGIRSVVYGAVDRTAVVAGAVLATTALGLAGVLGAVVTPESGVRALGEVVVPVPFLQELATRGVRAAAFEGVMPAA